MKIDTAKLESLSLVNATTSQKSKKTLTFEAEKLKRDKEEAKKILDAILEKALAGLVTRVSGPKG